MRNFAPKKTQNITAFEVMTPKPITVEGIITVEYLMTVLKKTFSMFPVLNRAGNLVGMIPKNFIIVLLENHHFYDVSLLDENQK